MNATYIISIARKLGCSIFLLPEDLIEVILHLVNYPYLTLAFSNPPQDAWMTDAFYL